jgi:predicted  nucleic acid-binding Zn-ribbon protein
MAETRTLANVPLKIGLGKTHTSNAFNVNQESISSSFISATQNIWSQTIDSNPATAEAEFVVSQVLTLEFERIVGLKTYRIKLPSGQLSKLTGKINPLTGSVYQADDFVGHIIPSQFGSGYKPVMRNSSNAILEDADSSAWTLDPFAGVLSQENEDFPLDGGTIECRVYIGKFLDQSLSDFDNVVISGGSTPQSVFDEINSKINAISGDVLGIGDLSGYATTSQLTSVSANLDSRVTTNEDDIVTIQSDISALQSDVSSLSTSGGVVLPSELDALETLINDISASANTNEDNISALATNLGNTTSQLTTDISNVDSKVNDNTSLINNLSGSNDVINSNIQNLNTKVDNISGSLQTQIDVHDTQISSLSNDLISLAISGGAVLPSDISDLQTQINSITANVLTNSDDIDSLTTSTNASISGINSTLVNTNNSISQLSSDISTNNSNISSLNTQLNGISGIYASQDSLTTEINALSGELKSDISGLQGQITTNSNDITSLQSDVASLSISGGAVLPSDVQAVQTQVDALSAAINAHENSNNSQFSTLINDISANSAAISSVNGDIISNTNAIAGVGSSILANTNDISELRSVLSSISGNVGEGGPVISGGVGVIGVAEDGDYTDGLFTDFDENTPIGTAIDRFNEVLKSMVSFPPSLSNTSIVNGESGKLGYDLSHLSTEALAYAVFPGNTFNNSVNNAIFDANDNITGTLANNVSAHADGSYDAKSFKDGDKGVLKLTVNGVDIHTVDLSVFGSGSSTNGNNSTFTNSSTGAGVWYRTGTWEVKAADLIQGYNFITITHDIEGSLSTTQQEEIMIDANNENPTISGQTLSRTGSWGTKFLSGVTYFTSGQFSFNATIGKVYNMTYSTDNITHPTSDYVTASNQSIPAAINDSDDTFNISETFGFDIGNGRLLGGNATISTRVPKPLGRTQTSGIVSVNGLLADNNNTNSTNLVEKFNNEQYRMYPGGSIASNTSYSSGAQGSPFTWDSSKNLAINSNNEYNGLMFYNGALRSPKQGVNGGNFSSLVNGPASNANYSGMSGDLTFYRYFYVGDTFANFTLNLTVSNTTFGSSASGNQVLVEAMIPGSGTGYGVLYDCNEVQSNGGIYGSTYGNNKPTNWGITFPVGVNTATTKAIVLKITANANWTGNISNISVTPVSQG